MFDGMGGAYAPQNAMESMYGREWYRDPALRRYFSQLARAYRENAGVVVKGSKTLRTYPFGVRMQMQSADFDKTLAKLPLALAARIQRKGLKKGLLIWRDALRGAFSRHRSPLLRPHLADHVAAHSRCTAAARAPASSGVLSASATARLPWRRRPERSRGRRRQAAPRWARGSTSFQAGACTSS